MAKSHTSKRDEKHELTRRALIKWSVVTGAALGLSRSKIFEVLEGAAGKSIAFAAAAQPINRTFDIEGGNAGISYMTQFWPYPNVAPTATPTNNIAWGYPGQQTLVQGTPRPLMVGPDTPWTKLPANKQVTVFVCGANNTHTIQAPSTNTIAGNSLLASNAALQAALPAVVPTVTVGKNISIGTAPGAGAAANVVDASGVTSLFNSVASRAGGLLVNSNDAELYASHFRAFVQLNRAANRPTTTIGYNTATGAAQFLGTNLSSQLTVTQADLDRYGITSGTRTNVSDLGKTMIVAVKAFKHGLTNGFVTPAMTVDPHGHFDTNDGPVIMPQLKGIFDGFMTDLQNTLDDNTQKPLADNIVITVKGDTPKDVFQKGGWSDSTKANHNLVYMYSAGQIYPGWMGDVSATGTVQGVGADGKLTTYNGTMTANYALASVLYAVAQGDDRAIQGLAGGVTVANVFGYPRNI
jgi:hypothetical protein